MKVALVTTALFLTLSGSAQDAEKVNENNTKINELNERLDNLLGTNKPSEADSSNIKLNLIMTDLKQIKEELSKLKVSVNEIQAGSSNPKLKEESITNNTFNLDTAGYYVVLISDRTIEGAQKKFQKVSTKEEILLIQNNRQSWYHVVVKKPVTLTQAGQVTQKFRINGFADAWWTTGRKLMH